MRLQDIMSAGVVTIGPDDLVSTARAVMRQHRIRHLVVVEKGRTAGILSERDLGGERATTPPAERRVRDVMITDVVSATPETTLRQAANLMRGRTIGSLLVVKDDSIVGLVTTTDLLDQLGRGAIRPNVRVERPPLRRPPSVSQIRRGRSPRGPTGPRRGARPKRQPAQRVPLPTAVPRVAKRTRGRSLAVPPAHVRVIGAMLDHADRETIARKLGMRLGKFASSIERISVRLSDVNGPKGGVDHRCVIKVVMSGLPSVVVERTDSTLSRAIDSAISAVGQAVRRSVQRRRLKPLHGRTSRSVTVAS